jgi:hypothetical protein
VTAANQNTFSYHEDRNSKTFTGAFSNEAVDAYLAEFFAYRAERHEDRTSTDRTSRHRNRQQQSAAARRSYATSCGPASAFAPTETDDKVRIAFFRENDRHWPSTDDSRRNAQDAVRRSPTSSCTHMNCTVVS